MYFLNNMLKKVFSYRLSGELLLNILTTFFYNSSEGGEIKNEGI